ncbi:hypothetical protein SLOPH_610, partial [Spraguea lophii 42_110]
MKRIDSDEYILIKDNKPNKKELEKANDIIKCLFYNNSLKDLYVSFSKEVDNIEPGIDYNLEIMNEIRINILKGEIDKCITLMNDKNIELLNKTDNHTFDTNKYPTYMVYETENRNNFKIININIILYYLRAHQVKELISKNKYTEALTFINEKIKILINNKCDSKNMNNKCDNKNMNNNLKYKNIDGNFILEHLSELIMCCVFKKKVDIENERKILSERINNLIREKESYINEIGNENICNVSELERIIREVKLLEKELG